MREGGKMTGKDEKQSSFLDKLNSLYRAIKELDERVGRIERKLGLDDRERYVPSDYFDDSPVVKDYPPRGDDSKRFDPDNHDDIL